MSHDLRDYQATAIAAAYAEFRLHKGTLLVLATGTGKTVIFSRICRDGYAKGRKILVLAHRDELINQASAKIEREIGVPVGVELGNRRAATRPELGLGDGTGLIVVSSTQTMGRRYSEVAPDFFDLIILDEAHHALAASNVRIFAHFAKAKRLGVTATPERGDKKGLIEIFDSVAFELPLLEAMARGWLVPIRFRSIDLPGLDLSVVGRKRGDFDRNALAEVMEKLDLLRAASIEIVNAMGSRPTLVFCVSVQHAHLQAESLREVLRDHGIEVEVASLDGTAKKEQREQVVADFTSGKIRVLCGCDLFTEGFDAPPTALVAVLRPTMSRPLYMQMLGRGTRPLAGVVDGLPTPEARRAAIAASSKPDMLLLDFVGNTGKHELVSPIDLLGEDVTADEVRDVKALLDAGDVQDLLTALEMARAKRLAAERARLAREGDFFALFGYSRKRDGWAREMTPAQSKAIASRDIQTPGLDFTSANQILTICDERRRQQLCTYKQARLLARLHVPLAKLETLRVEQATETIKFADGHGWRPPRDPPWWKAFLEPAPQSEESS